jgi:hypothetical protein
VWRRGERCAQELRQRGRAQGCKSADVRHLWPPYGTDRPRRAVTEERIPPGDALVEDERQARTPGIHIGWSSQ